MTPNPSNPLPIPNANFSKLPKTAQEDIAKILHKTQSRLVMTDAPTPTLWIDGKIEEHCPTKELLVSRYKHHFKELAMSEVADTLRRYGVKPGK